jgi:hypothetical protein
MNKSTEFNGNTYSPENNLELSNVIPITFSKNRRNKRLNRRLNQAYWLGSRFQALANLFDKKAA